MKIARFALTFGLCLSAWMGWSRPENPSVVIDGVKFVYKGMRGGVQLVGVKQANDLPLGRQPLVIPAVLDGKPLLSLSDSVLSKSSISSLVLPNSITAVSMSCCADCSNLERVVIGARVTDIKRSAFAKCTRLNAVEFAPGSALATVGVLSFSGCRALTTLSLPSGVKKISGSAFQGCDRLARINLPEGLLTIDDGAFAGCAAMQEIRLPETLSALGSNVFANSGLRRLEIPNGVKDLKMGLCSGCATLESVKLGSNVKTIGRSAFAGCSRLAVFSVPDDSLLERILPLAFKGCSSLTSFSFPANLKSVDRSAFQNTTISVPAQFVK